MNITLEGVGILLSPKAKAFFLETQLLRNLM